MIMKAILACAVMNATQLVAKNKALKKFRHIRDFNPSPLRYRCSVLPTELTSQMGAGHYVDFK